jgi:hypothetical protein
MLMGAGVAMADLHGIEAWMEASSMGKAMYEQHGFRPLFRMDFDTEKPNASDTWRRCAHEMTPGPFWPMWRPKRGFWELGGTAVKMPWELGVEKEEVNGSTTA